MFIDGSYFTGKILIPNKTYGAEPPEIYNSDILQAIDEYEKEILISLLGYPLYKTMVDDLDGSGDPQSSRFINLIDGSEFQNIYGGVTQTLKWNGFRNEEKLSLSADYTFYKYIERNNTKMSSVGNVDIKAENADKVSPIRKMTDSWYSMRKLYGIIPYKYERWLKSIEGKDLPCTFDSLPSAYNFLFANKTIYPEWIFTPVWSKSANIFGL